MTRRWVLAHFYHRFWHGNFFWTLKTGSTGLTKSLCVSSSGLSNHDGSPDRGSSQRGLDSRIIVAMLKRLGVEDGLLPMGRRREPGGRDQQAGGGGTGLPVVRGVYE